MEFFRRAAGQVSALGVLAGTFNPPTRAHLALASAALSVAGEVVFVLPRRFPHKSYEGASFEDRVRMLELATAGEPRFSIASTDTGLFLDVARACRRAYGPGVRLLFLCGSDAAERMINWDYGRPGAVAGQLEEFELLVADRQGRYQPPPELRARIHRLPVAEDLGAISATEIRERIRRGQPWRHLAPEAIAAEIERCYGAIP
jgi:nicotinate-nucleotide adenylyltransferase